MSNDLYSDKPTFEGYREWHQDNLLDDLRPGRTADKWYEITTDHCIAVLNRSAFWQQLQSALSSWSAEFSAEHEGYPLLALDLQPTEIQKKPFESAINKTFRWNILNNGSWPDPPERSPSTSAQLEGIDRYDVNAWYGPKNWLRDFPDIFRIRLTTTYFDGVRYLADRVKKLAEETTSTVPELEYKASLEGYHAAHVLNFHDLEIFEYETGDLAPVRVSLEVQVVTTIQDTIINMLHSVYDDWRLNGTPPDWQWDHQNPAFSVNYLGSTLHYLEGMIVLARDQKGTS